MTVFFSDIEGFTPLCEQLTPDGVVKLLNKYFSAMSAPIQDNHGAIDKFNDHLDQRLQLARHTRRRATRNLQKQE